MEHIGSITEVTSLGFRVDSQLVSVAPNGSTTYTASRTVSLPNIDANEVLGGLGTIQTWSAVNTFSSQITASAGVLGNVTGDITGNVTGDISGNAATVTTNANLTGDITSVGNATVIAAGVIIDADIKSDAEIATSKLADSVQINRLALGGTLTTLGAWTQTGAHTLGITTTANTTVTLPTSGTLAVTTTKLDDWATPDDNTDLDATTGYHGLLPKLAGGTTKYLRADGTWVIPAGAGDTIAPATNTDTAIALWDGTDSKTLQNSGITVDSSDNVSGIGTLGCNVINSTDGVNSTLIIDHEATATSTITSTLNNQIAIKTENAGDGGVAQRRITISKDGDVAIAKFLSNGKTSDTTTQGSQNNFALSTGITYFTNTGTAITFTGFAAKTEGTIVYIANKTGESMTFTNASGSSDAVNRFDMTGDKTVLNSEVAAFVYLGSRWMIFGV